MFFYRNPLFRPKANKGKIVNANFILEHLEKTKKLKFKNVVENIKIIMSLNIFICYLFLHFGISKNF